MENEFIYNKLDRGFYNVEITDTEDVVHKFTLRELTKKHLEAYIDKVYTVDSYEDAKNDKGELEKDEDGTVKRRLRKFKDLTATQTESLCEYFALSCGQKGFDKKFFMGLSDKLTMRQFGSLIEKVNKLNDVDALLGSLGNLAMLPMVVTRREQTSSESATP